MEVRYEDLEELCQTLGDKISEANEKIRSASGDLTGGDLEYIDKLTHALKSIKTTMAMMEADGYSHDMGYSGTYTGSYPGRYYPGSSYARGRGAKRDSMGRYSRRGYSRGENEEAVEQLRAAMESAPDEKTRQDIQRIISRMEG